MSHPAPRGQAKPGTACVWCAAPPGSGGEGGKGLDKGLVAQVKSNDLKIFFLHTYARFPYEREREREREREICIKQKKDSWHKLKYHNKKTTVR